MLSVHSSMKTVRNGNNDNDNNNNNNNNNKEHMSRS